MKLLDSPRQPLVGAALAAVAGILLAEFLSAPLSLVCIFLAAGAIVSLIRPRIGLTVIASCVRRGS